MTKLLLAKTLIDSNLPLLANKCAKLKAQGVTPKIKIILVGENSASRVYVNHKKTLCEKVGAEFELNHLPETVSKQDFLNAINDMNNDPKVTGCFVQLPVPAHLQDIDITQLINPDKDVDGFHSRSFINIYKNSNVTFYPCTPKGIVTLLKHYDIPISGKHIVVIGRSLIVGKPLSLMFSNLNATVTMCHSKTHQLEMHTRAADIIVAAVGIPKYLTTKHFRNDNSQVVVDVGMNRDENGKLCGDVDFENVKDQLAAITPVPGGVGPLTVYSLIENLMAATENILQTRNQ